MKLMHVLFLPKWYPGIKDPQLGDFLRKQALAAGAFVQMSVLHVEASTGKTLPPNHVVDTSGGAWELRVHYRASSSRFMPWRKAVNFVRYWRTMRRGWDEVVTQRGKPDIIHAYILMRPVLFAWWTARWHRIPFLISEQSSEYVDGTYARKNILYKALSHFLFRRAAAVTAVSAWLGDALVDHALCKRYTVVPNVIPGLDRPLPTMGVPGHFLVVADLVDRTKNVSGVLRALESARKSDPRLRLGIIGDGVDRRMLEELTDHLGLRSCVTFHGRVPNTVVLDHMASIFGVIVNSNVETFSVVTGEALAQGKPVIATRCGGPVAFITPENGMLIEPKDSEALAKAMLDMVARSAAYDPATIRRSVSERFSPDAVGRSFQGIYQDIVQHGK